MTRAASPGPHLLVVPVTAVSSWRSALASSVPGLSVVHYTGGPQDRRRAREQVTLSSVCPNILLTTYRTFFLDSAWFLTRPWSLLVLAETQNVSAAATDQIRDLASLKAARRLLLASGEIKENPIDLWNTLYLMFPSLYFQREEMDEVGVEVAGTPKYVEIKASQGLIFSQQCQCSHDDYHSLLLQQLILQWFQSQPLQWFLRKLRLLLWLLKPLLLLQ